MSIKITVYEYLRLEVDYLLVKTSCQIYPKIVLFSVILS